MDAIGLNPIKLDAIGLDPIRMNAIRLGVPVASSGSGRPYIDPELLSHVKMAISTWGKTNDDPDRAVLKDLSGNGNDMRLLNFRFAENSGYGLYGANFNKWAKDTESNIDVNSNRFTINGSLKRTWVMWCTVKLPSLKIRISGINPNGYVLFQYNDNGSKILTFNKDGIYTLPSIEANSNGTGFLVNTLTLNWEGLVIEQLPDFEGWLCTDGVEDMIESVKPISEMLEGSNEITVVSIIHGIGSKNAYTNVLRESGSNYIRNTSTADGKTGIYGYTCKDTTKSIITDILGDKNDYKLEYIQTTTPSTVNSVFSVAGWRENSGSMIVYPVAYAGGFIANKVLTTDEINQIIAYFNLDRPGQIIKPQLYCNIKKQGITNDNHAEFNDQLIDFVGGHNIQLNNISWEGESGINSYPVVFGANKTWINLRTNDNIKWSYELTSNRITIYKVERSTFPLFYSYIYNEGIVSNITISPFNIKVSGLKTGESIRYYYVSTDNTAIRSYINITANGVHKLPASVSIQITEESPSSIWVGMTMTLINNENIEGVTIEILPTIENALCLDGISDFGKATGLPILKDYTICALRKWLYGDSVTSTETGSIVSKSKVGNDGAFILEQTFNRNPSRSSTFSFGTINSLMSNDKLNEESFTYQTKYSYNGEAIVSGSGVDSDSMWLGTIRDGDSRFSKFALWSLMLFPYSLSWFLLERQLRKYKAGTLYPDMIEFRPVIKSNIPYSSVSYSVNPGEYITEGSTVTITITLSNASDKLIGVSSNAISDISISGDNGVYEVTGKVTKSPQKINIVISSYLTMLGNETLISNETLIKNE